jgi:hypothetical protein
MRWIAWLPLTCDFQVAWIAPRLTGNDLPRGRSGFIPASSVDKISQRPGGDCLC